MTNTTFTAAEIVAKLKEIDGYDAATGEGTGEIMFGSTELYVNKLGEIAIVGFDGSLCDEEPDWLDGYTWVSNMGWFFTFPEGSLTEFGVDGYCFWTGWEQNGPATAAEFAALDDPAARMIYRELETCDYGYCWNLDESVNITAYELLATNIAEWRDARAAGILPQELTGYIDDAHRTWKELVTDIDEVTYHLLLKTRIGYEYLYYFIPELDGGYMLTTGGDPCTKANLEDAGDEELLAKINGIIADPYTEWEKATDEEYEYVTDWLCDWWGANHGKQN